MQALLEGKVIVVTGAGAGVGKGIAIEAARQGARVIVNDLGVNIDGSGASSGPAQQTVDEILAFGGTAAANTESVAEWKSAQSIITQALDLYGRIDGLVNNAGNLRDVIFHKMEKTDWDIVRAVNLDGYFYVSRAAAGLFKEQNSGCFIHMTSTSGLIGNLGQANYAAAKLGVAALSKGIAIDMEKFNVRSNCIAPFAFTRIVGTIPANTEVNRKRLENMQKMTPDKIAPLAVALMADAAKDITGQIFAARKNELMLFSQNRPLRTAHTAEGWTPQTVIDTVLPAFRGHAYPLHRSADVFFWDPV